jgi:enoyl-CoA hydratase/carnithine racemase
MRGGYIPDDPAELAESPVSANLLHKQIVRFPEAAAAALDLLRAIDLDNPAKGLEQESRAYGALQASSEHAAWLAQRRRERVSPPGSVLVSGCGNVIEILLDRADARNAIDCAMRDTLHAAFSVAALDPDVKAVRLRGAGRAFCAGADLNEFGTTRDPEIAHVIRMQTLPAHAIILCAHKFAAHVQGACVGAGLEMVVFARRLTASPDAWFQLPELAMGLIPGAGGCVSIPWRIGRRRAALMILSGKRIGARTALDWGLIDAIVDDAPSDHSQADIVR